MPDFASRNEARTSCTPLPMEETIPMPVTTTRFMRSVPWKPAPLCCNGSDASRRGFARLEQPDPQILGRINGRAVGLQPAVAGAKGEFPSNHALQLDDIFELLHGRQHHAGEFDFADAECAALARCTEPTQEKAEQLPKRVKTEAARHDWIALKMAGEKPEIGLHVELGHDAPMPVLATLFFDLRYTVEHQHRPPRYLSDA